MCGLTGRDVIPGTEKLHMDVDFQYDSHWDDNDSSTKYYIGYARGQGVSVSPRFGVVSDPMYQMGLLDGIGDRHSD